MSTKSRNGIFHPFIASVFPPLSLYLHNVGRLYFWDAVKPVGATLIAVAIFWWSSQRFLKDRARSAMVTTLAFLMFFSFGHFTAVLEKGLAPIGPAFVSTVTTRSTLTVLAIIWLGLWFLVSLLALRARLNFDAITQFMNVFSLALMVMLGVRYVAFVHYRNTLRQEASGVAGFAPVPASANLERLPDIYYLVIDGYGRADVLRNLYGFDNAEFVGFLEEQGFYLADASNANYNITLLSLASTLNFDYLDSVAAQVDPDSVNPLPAFSLIQNSRLLEYFHSQGYTIANFASGYAVTELATADVDLAPKGGLNPFETALVNTTPLQLLFTRKQYDFHRERVLFALDQLPEVAQLEGPVFAFAHIVAPHPPFVFDAEGNPLYPDMPFILDDGSFLTKNISREIYLASYRAQAQYITLMLQQTLARLLENASHEAIIIVQSDHGPGAYLDWGSLENSNLQERLGILNAYYFPDQNYSSLYPGISPVNTFRVILNRYFGADYPLLEDRSFFALMHQPYRFNEVTDRLGAP